MLQRLKYVYQPIEKVMIVLEWPAFWIVKFELESMRATHL